MINTLLITHTKIARSLLDVTLRIYPQHKLNYRYIEIDCCDNKSYYQQKYNEALNSIHKLTSSNHINCLILTDLFGATPYNIANRVAVQTNNCILSGVSLAMLLKLFNLCDLEQPHGQKINYHQLAKILAKSSKDATVHQSYIKLNEQVTESSYS